MASKMGTILSLFFFAMALFIGADILRLQFMHSALDALATSLSEKIAIEGDITLQMRNMVTQKYGARLVKVTTSAMVGEFLEFKILYNFTPIIISNEVMTITIDRMVLIGYID